MALFVLLAVFILGIVIFILPKSAPAAASEEERIAEICSGVSGAGKCSVIINRKDGEMVSVAVLCEGAESPYVEGKIKSLIKSLYDIGYNRVSVLKLSE